MNWTPTVSLAVPTSEVTLANNSAALAAAVQKTVSVASVITTTGPASLAQYVGDAMNFNIGGCMNPAGAGNSPLGSPTSGPEISQVGDAGVACAVAFTNAPDPAKLPAGYVLASPTPTLVNTPDSLGNDHFLATWNAVPPSAVSITGSVQGAPSTFPADLVGKTVNYSLDCAPGAAIPASGQLTIDANGQLTAPSTVVPSGSNCTAMTIDGIGQLPAAPQNYEWKSSSATLQGSNAFVATLVMAPKQQAVTVTGVVTGAPPTFPADLVGKTVALTMNCTPDAAQPDTVTLTIDATGHLSTPTQPMVSATASCSPQLAESTPSLALPQDYEWKPSSVSPASGNSSFVITLTMAKKTITPTLATPVPTLGEWAVYALSVLMLLAAAWQMRMRGQRAQRQPTKR
ncbi:IPTL-CTERM sorting domain-containing protein [Diaphorobacter aerolatus]|uniref:IPTL-CTERM sorting domain-containing protein n=1 Tax=Diaphorobacter aerolatus TaxID=1288495 RepID=A0A7H0GPR4_9BURK|nr:IPTL-CTERM sorting domain-containing protein [Diaphorobacter aerolatus]QNP50280.1 IPTL-CTERM sorting domain-containing protein [Diaphorobacter aerolatus]